jgi:hypothetical protein
MAPNPANAFAIHDTFTVFLGAGERVQGEGTTDVSAASVPEPASGISFALGLAFVGLGDLGRRAWRRRCAG